MSARLFAHYFEDPQKNDRADQRNDKAPNTKARQPLPAECIHHKSTDKRTDHADDDIRQQALIFVRTHELGRDPPRETADDDPSQETYLLYAAPPFVNDTASIAYFFRKSKNRLRETIVDKLQNSWCGLGDSNSWPLPWQGSALTTELNPHASTPLIITNHRVLCNIWWLLPDLNWGHKALQASALPTELKSRIGIGLAPLLYDYLRFT